ncbi:metallophosphoesterase [Croceiramulus getboli]|nr:metallophosphoesterase [Flavobacteriaceae bacterium YJPT1-3]
MRTYSFFTIALLCLAIVIIDALAFFWLQAITDLLTSNTLRNFIHILFWVFTLGLVIAILTLKLRMNAISPRWKQRLVTSMYGLTVSSFIPKGIFVLLITLMYYSTLTLPNPKTALWVALFGLIAGFLPFFVIVYAIFGAVYRFKVRRTQLSFKNLPSTIHNLRIVQISDLHLGSFGFKYKTLDRAIRMINELEPDLLFFTGDLVNNYAWELRGWDQVFQKLRPKLGAFAVLGNHDYGDYSIWDSAFAKAENREAIRQFFERTPFRLLLNEAVILKRGRDQLAIIGVENWGKPPFKQYGDLAKAQKQVPADAFKILLSHDPSHWEAEVVENTDIDLTFSGHTHGMQVALIVGKKEYSPIQLKYKQWAGLYSKGNQYLYVNRGLGWMGFPGRIGVRPEITLLELVRVQQQ